MMHGDSLAAGIAMISRSTSSRSGQDRRLLLVRTCDVLNTPRNDVSAQNTFDDSRYVSFSTYINTRACRFYSQARLRFEAFQELSRGMRVEKPVVNGDLRPKFRPLLFRNKSQFFEHSTYHKIVIGTVTSRVSGGKQTSSLQLW